MGTRRFAGGFLSRMMSTRVSTASVVYWRASSATATIALGRPVGIPRVTGLSPGVGNVGLTSLNGTAYDLCLQSIGLRYTARQSSAGGTEPDQQIVQELGGRFARP